MFGVKHTWGDELARNLALSIKVASVTVDEAALADASTEVAVVTLPANAWIIGHALIINEVFAGEADVAVNLGGTDVDAIVADYALDSVAAGTYLGTAGAMPTGPYGEQDIVLTFTATGLADLSAGNLTAKIAYIVIGE
jgi:hypothetical protein